jgi:hypothetical protein
VGVEPTASLVLSQGGLPIAYRATTVSGRQCPEQNLNLHPLGFKPNRSAVGVPGQVVPSGVEPLLPGCEPGVVPLDHGTESGLTGNRTRISCVRSKRLPVGP